MLMDKKFGQDKVVIWCLIILVVLIVGEWITLQLLVPSLPASIPLHYGTSGIDRWGEPADLYGTLRLNAVIALAMAILAFAVYRQPKGRIGAYALLVASINLSIIMFATLLFPLGFL